MRQWITVCEARRPPAYVYHGTISNHIESIYTHGFRPDATRAVNWNFSDNPQGVVWFAGTEATARDYGGRVAANQYYRMGASRVPHVVLLRVPVSAIRDLHPDPSTPGEYYTRQAVPPNRIQVYLHDRWQNLAKVNSSAIESIADGSWDDLDDD